ncbi:MAG: response regulator [Magnetococcus sp. YQC-5]
MPDSDSDALNPVERATILVIDDTTDNLTLMSSLLKDFYKVKVSNNGERALKYVQGDNKVDLILLDIMMPDMDGYDVCRLLKSNKKTADIPTIFLTSLNSIDDEAKGLALGAVDYITKPITPAILLARVKTHLDLGEARRNLQEAHANLQNVLNQTLSGTTSVMTEVLCLANPVAFGRAMRLRNLIHEMVKQIGRADAWQFELSAILSQLGCVTLPTNVLQKLHRGLIQNADDQARCERYPELSAKLVARIPRLEEIAQIVETHMKPRCAPFHGDLKTRPAAILGAQMLKLAIDYDTEILNGKTARSTMDALFMDANNYDPMLVAILRSVVTTERKERQVMLNDLKVGMILAKDMVGLDGESILKGGTELTSSTLNLISYMGRTGAIEQPVAVLVVAG